MRFPFIAALSLPLFGCFGAVDPSAPGAPDAADSGAPDSAAADVGSNVCPEIGALQSCWTSPYTGGLQSCDAIGDGGLAWTPCTHATECTVTSCTTASGVAGAACDEGACVPIGNCDPTAPPSTPGSSSSGGSSSGSSSGGSPPGNGPGGECPGSCGINGGSWNLVEPPCNTPLVLAFENERVDFTRATGAFDLVGSGVSIDTDWVSPATPWLAIDRDGNGAIDDGSELFGSMTALPGGAQAKNGFEALAALDADADGKITAADPAFSRLLVWRDANQDRRTTPEELTPASAVGLVAIDLHYAGVPLCSNGSCEVERARFVFRDSSGRERTGAVIDVHLALR